METAPTNFLSYSLDGFQGDAVHKCTARCLWYHSVGEQHLCIYFQCISSVVCLVLPTPISILYVHVIILNQKTLGFLFEYYGQPVLVWGMLPQESTEPGAWIPSSRQ